jgi:hypothetical protein
MSIYFSNILILATFYFVKHKLRNNEKLELDIFYEKERENKSISTGFTYRLKNKIGIVKKGKRNV